MTDTRGTTAGVASARRSPLFPGRQMVFGVVMLCLAPRAYAADLEKAPVSVQAALFLKLLAFHKTISSSTAVTIHVVDNTEFAKEMRKGVGKKVGTATLDSVAAATKLPETPPSAIYVKDKDRVGEVTKYCRDNGVLSITGDPDLVNKGVTLAIGTAEGKPQVLLNAAASKAEGAKWDPAIFKIARLIK